MKKKIISGVGLFISLYISVSFNSGCAQIGSPTGGVRDTLSPVLIKSTPAVKSLNFSGNKITLSFDEYVTLLEPQNNILVSPLPKNNPVITNSLKTVSVKLKDSLLPNTTYSIQFGNSIRDINESNILTNFTYVFSTGKTIDSMMLKGKVLLAETGLADSTISVILYKNSNDTAVQKLKPDYLAKLKGDGSFTFSYLPAGIFKIYALKDGDGSKNYNSKTELFAFQNDAINIDEETANLTMYAFSEEKPKDDKVAKVLKPALEKKLRYNSNITGAQDLLSKFELSFNNPLKLIDTNKLILTDTNFNKIQGGQVSIDSTRKLLTYSPVWIPGAAYRLIISPDAIEDSAGNKPLKTDTIAFIARMTTDYGRVVLRFKNYNQSKNPVLQFISNDVVKYSFPLNGAEWINNRMLPAEYQIRILFDDNKDGLWTSGNYSKKLQPEKVVSLPKKISIRADWDNESDIDL